MRLDALGAALSGIRSALTRQATSAHNIANVNTDGFQPLRTIEEESAAGGSSARVVRDDAPGVDLAGEAVEQIRSQYGLAANARVVKTQQSLLGSILDLFG